MKVLELIEINGVYCQHEREATAEEIAAMPEESPEQKIETLKQMLSETDYKAIKFAEGLLTEEEYAPTRTQRQAWRDEINRLEE